MMMEAEMETSPPSVACEDIAAQILERLESSTAEEDRQLCSVVGATAQALRDQGIPPTAVAYFAALASSLDRLPHDDPSVSALVAFLAEVLPRVSQAVLRVKGSVLYGSLVRVLGFGSVLHPWTVKPGLVCAAHVLVAGGKGSWSSVQQLFGVLLSFITDPRPKVRKQAHVCLGDILSSFEGHDISSSASEQIISMFERSLLLAGGSKTSGSASEEGYKGALDVLYILHALKNCISLMPMRFVNRILNNFKILLDLRHSIVTRSVMDVLKVLCSRSTSNIDAGRFSDVLCALALSVNSQEKFADDLSYVVHLLQNGIKKVYDLDKEVCFVKLPIIFTALGESLACGHEEVIQATTEALKDLIYSCYNETLIEEGVKQARLILSTGMRSGPTTIEKICATLEGFLGYRYSSVWDKSFQILSATFDKLGKNISFLMAHSIKSLADMQNLPDKELFCRKELHQALGSAVRALGPAEFLHLLPLNLDAENMSDNNAWLIPILEKYIVGAPLKFFLEHILKITTSVQQKSFKFSKEGMMFSARSQEGLVYSLWCLLPAFCNYPIDFSSSSNVLKYLLLKKLREEPELRSIICSSLQILIKQNSANFTHDDVLDNDLSISERKARAYYTREVREENLIALRSYLFDFLCVLYEIFMDTTGDSGGFLLATVSQFASLPREGTRNNDVNKFFGKIMRKLLDVSSAAVKAKNSENSTSMQIDGSPSSNSFMRTRALLLDLAVSLLPGLDKDEVLLLLVAIKPAFQDESLIQKKAYKALSIILKDRKTHVYLSDKLNELLESMVDALSSCHFSAKRHRLDALCSLIIYISEDSSGESYQTYRDTFISSFLTEIILALKESNKKTRDRAYELLVQIGHVCRDVEKHGNFETLICFFHMVSGGLAGNTPQMISAAIRGLACLAYKFPDLIVEAYKLLPSAFLLLQRENREIIKANLGLVKVLVVKSGYDTLQSHLQGIVEGLMNWKNSVKKHFKSKVKVLVQTLVKKCGMDAVKAVMPEEHMKLLTNIRKNTERNERKAKSDADTESVHSRTTISRQSTWNHSRIFSDFGDDDDNDSENEDSISTTRRSKAFSSHSKSLSSRSSSRKRLLIKSLSENQIDQGDDPLDLLDNQSARLALHSVRSPQLKRKTDSDEPEIDPLGRLIIRDEEKRSGKERDPSSDGDLLEIRPRLSSGSRASTVSRAMSQKRRKTDAGWAYSGSEYKNKRASGDMKKKDKLEPYAYWPLDRKLLNRKAEHKAAARKGMAKVVKFAKKLEGKSTAAAVHAVKKSMSFKKNKKKALKK